MNRRTPAAHVHPSFISTALNLGLYESENKLMPSVALRTPSRPESFPGASDCRVLHSALSRFNSYRLAPTLPARRKRFAFQDGYGIEELGFLDAERKSVSRRAATASTGGRAFMEWFENLTNVGPGQGDSLFPWLATRATLKEMEWFLTQEAAGEAGFEDLVAMAQVRFPTGPKLEMARNYWDEMGRGHESGMHGPMLAKVVDVLALKPSPKNTVWESLALSNLMVGLVANRHYAYHAIGALGVIEMTAPGRVSCVNEGLRRLGVPTSARLYFQLHAGLDVQHSKSWNREVIEPLAASDPKIAIGLAEGALMRLEAGARCFRRYRQHFGIVAT